MLRFRVYPRNLLEASSDRESSNLPAVLRREVTSAAALFVAALFMVLALLTSWNFAAEPPKRSRPPRWSRDVLDAFFENAENQLFGERPTHFLPDNPSRVAATLLPSKQPADAEQKWSTLIDAETLTAEIKRINNRLAAPLKNLSAFKAGGNKACRRDFGLLSVLFGVIDQFDEDVRWQRSAKQMQSRSFRASQTCQAASAPSYAAAKNAQAVLEELLRGQAPPESDAPNNKDSEQQLIEITQVMQNMEVAMKERLAPTLTNAREFRKRSHLAAEQAQILVMLAKLAQHPKYGYEEEDTYLSEARQLIQASEELSQAAQEKNYEAARKAVGRVSQACSRCHEDYR